VDVGDAVVAGQLLGTIVAHDGRVVERTVAPEAGIVAMVRRIPPVATGDGLFLLTRRTDQG
jgi:predicted deacylase